MSCALLDRCLSLPPQSARVVAGWHRAAASTVHGTSLVFPPPVAVHKLARLEAELAHSSAHPAALATCLPWQVHAPHADVRFRADSSSIDATVSKDLRLAISKARTAKGLSQKQLAQVLCPACRPVALGRNGPPSRF